jgi:hypothetical protein
MQKATETSKTHQLYPTAREEYTYRVGAYAEEVITTILENNGYSVEFHFVNDNGTDIVLSDYSVGVEVWNHCKPHNYEKKTNAVIENLKPFQRKFIVASFISKPTKAKLEAEGIIVIELDYQLLPNEYLSYYSKTKDTYGKKFSNKAILNTLANQLNPLMMAIGNQSIVTKSKTIANVFTIYSIVSIIHSIQRKLVKLNIVISKLSSEAVRFKLKNDKFKLLVSVKSRLIGSQRLVPQTINSGYKTHHV